MSPSRQSRGQAYRELRPSDFMPPTQEFVHVFLGSIIAPFRVLGDMVSRKLSSGPLLGRGSGGDAGRAEDLDPEGGSQRGESGDVRRLGRLRWDFAARGGLAGGSHERVEAARFGDEQEAGLLGRDDERVRDVAGAIDERPGRRVDDRRLPAPAEWHDHLRPPPDPGYARSPGEGSR
jgi:hypothetical protein